MARLFGTDGVRGIAGSELTPTLAFQLGRAGAYVLAQETEKPKILVGMDTRISCDMLESALIAGILSAGADAISVGVIPTPGIAYLTKARGAAAGVVISASHNPAKYNGIKFFSGEGYKLPDETEDKIQALIESDGVPTYTGADIGRHYLDFEAAEDYARYAEGTISESLSGLRIAVDCANGATSKISPKVLERLGAEVAVIGADPNGLNINDGCGSTHMEGLSEFVKNGNFDLGIAFDGDGDRVLFTDADGNFIDGDHVMAVIAIHLKNENKLQNNTLVATVMSNLGLEIACRENGITLLRTAVGDRYVLEAMLKEGHILGGEQSGHIIFSKHATTGDGLISALQFLSIMQKTGKTAAELSACMTSYPQVLKNVKVSNEQKYSFTKDAEIAKEISRIENELSGRGRILIRPSGTEPQVRIMLEGDNTEMIEKEANFLSDFILKRLES